MNFYHEASSVLDRLDARRGSIKGIIGLLPEKSRKRTAALVVETLKYKSALLKIIDNASLLKDERKHLPSKNLALVLVHDLLFAKGGIQASNGPIKQAVLRHKTRLQAELVKLKVKSGAKSNQELASEGDGRAAQIPRYARVNTVKWTMNDAIDYFVAKGFLRSTFPLESRASFSVDEHVPYLLCFHPSVSFHDDAAYLGGKLILQDKASCFPALVLDPEPDENTVVLDATAAPGNKTTHIGAIMQNRGKVLALERDCRRFATLQQMITLAGCRNIEAFNLDFLSTNPHTPQYAQVSHILLDPSCSGSGIVNRLDYLLETEQGSGENEEERLERLARFQLLMIKHAMKFPRVAKIVYSTCSIHATENEQVVARALDSEEARIGGFILAPHEHVLSAWKRRGISEELGSHSELGNSLIRCAPGEDSTNGFFVSCFIRKNPLFDTPLQKETDFSHKRKACAEQAPQLDSEGEKHVKKKQRKKRSKKQI